MVVDELQLMRGRGVKVGDLLIKPLNIGEIEELTESKYFQYISILTINKNSFKVEDEEIALFDLVFAVCTREEEFRNLFISSMSCFLREEIKMYANNSGFFFYTENKEICSFITKDNYNDIIEVIKLQNCLTKKIEDEENPANEKARQILERQKRARALLTKAKKQGDGEPLTLADLVSILSSNGNGVTPFNVWDLNFYMFNNQFNRMKMLEEYDINIRSLLAGAKSEDIQLKHWMSKI